MSGETDRREQPAQRVRIGVTGLAVVFLLVVVATALVRSGQHDSAAPVNMSNGAAEPNEPLAELGVAPGQSSRADNSADPARSR